MPVSKFGVRGAITLVVLAVLAFALNPSAEKHRSAIREATSERSPLAGLLGVGALTAFASTYHSVGVGSYTTVNDRVVSWGAYGQVFVSQR